MNHATRSLAVRLVASAAMLFGGLLLTVEAMATSVTYTGSVVTKVSLNGQMYEQAHVTFIFKGRVEDITQLTVKDSYGDVTATVSLITKGYARVVIEKGGEAITANIPQGQVFVSADTYNGGIGFGSTVASGQEPAYPLAFTLGSAGDYAESHGNDPNALNTTVNVSGAAWTCIGYPNTVPDCTDPTPYPIMTDQGPLIVYQPYVAEYNEGAHHGSMNRGVFQIFVGKPESD